MESRRVNHNDRHDHTGSSELQVVQDDEKNIMTTHEHPAFAQDLHDEVISKDVTADGLKNEMLNVDDERAAEIRRQLIASEQGGWKPITEEEIRLNKALNRRLDLFILPIVSLGYMFNQLDRSNLGNAQTAGFSSDIGIASNAVNNAATLFFATYIPLQPVAAAFGVKIGAVRFMAATLILWGTLTVCHAFVKNGGQLIALRLLMGLAECGFYPSVLAYLSRFYPRYECAFRFALFYGFFAVAGSFGGLIAFGILQANGSLHNWQYLFIIEGVVPVLLGIIFPFWMANDVMTAWYLSPEQRAFGEKRMVMDASANFGKERKVTKRDIKEAFTDWRVYHLMVSNTLASLSSQGFSIFFPVVVKGLGYSGVKANLLTVPPYALGAITVWTLSWSSDRFKERTYHLLIGTSISILGFILSITIPLKNVGGRYAALMIIMMGAFSNSPIAVAWLAGNTPEPGKRVVCIGISGWANLAGIIGSQLFKAQYGPTYKYPLKITLGLMCVSWAGFATLSIALRFVNKWRANKLADMTNEEIEEENRSDKRVGDKKYTFVYGL